MQRVSWRNGFALLACSVLLACGGHSKSNNAEALIALKNLRDQGVLTQAEYDAKVAALEGAAAGGLGAGAGVDPGATAPAADSSVGSGELGPGLAAGGNDFSGGTAAPVDSGAAPPPARRASHVARSRDIAPSEATRADGVSASAAPGGNARANAMHNLLAQAKAREAAVARSAHELALRMLQRATQAAPGTQHAPSPQDVQALRSYGQALMHGANPADAAAAASDPGEDAAQPH